MPGVTYLLVSLGDFSGLSLCARVTLALSHPGPVPLCPRADPSFLFRPLLSPKPLQTSGSPATPVPPAPSFSTLLQSAYAGQGALPLLDEGVQAQLQAALPRLPMHQALRSAKHLLLYVRSTVENFGQVSAAPAPLQPPWCVAAHRERGFLQAGLYLVAVSMESWDPVVSPFVLHVGRVVT